MAAYTRRVRRILPALLLPIACYGGVDPEASTDDETSASSSADDDDDTSPGSTSSGSASGTSASTTASSTTASSTSASTTDEPTTTTAPTTTDPSETTTDDPSSGGPPMPGEPTADEAELLELIDAYRAKNGLPSIPISTSMMIVAQTHAEDLAVNNPVTRECNLHSWSDAGAWGGCCYTDDHAQAQCMWDKPRELTDYVGDGFEIAASGTPTALSALTAWQGSPGHNDVIINAGTWADYPWNAIGAGMNNGYAVVWFGGEAD
jgi:uncharacterized protein YkwD